MLNIKWNTTMQLNNVLRNTPKFLLVSIAFLLSESTWFKQELDTWRCDDY